jgi:hypothetical protein
MTRIEREPMDLVGDCKLLVGGGRVYVVVDTIHAERVTSRLAKLLGRRGRPAMGRLVSVKRGLQILESDGSSARSLSLPQDARTAEVMPVGRELYLIKSVGVDEIARLHDGQVLPVPADEQEKIRQDLADDLEEQCTVQGWEYTSLTEAHTGTLSKTIPVGVRKVVVDLALEPPKEGRTRVLHVKVQAEGTKPLVRTFPDGQKEMF